MTETELLKSLLLERATGMPRWGQRAEKRASTPAPTDSEFEQAARRAVLNDYYLTGEEVA